MRGDNLMLSMLGRKERARGKRVREEHIFLKTDRSQERMDITLPHLTSLFPFLLPQKIERMPYAPCSFTKNPT